MNTIISLTLVTKCLEWSLDLGEDLISCLCLGLKSRALVLNTMAENVDALNVWWLGVFIAPPTKMAVGEAVCRRAHRTVRCATGHCPVRQTRHLTVRVRPLELLTAGPPDRCCSLSGAPSGAYSDSARAVRTVHYSFCSRSLAL
jgi:hypothetical protein